MQILLFEQFGSNADLRFVQRLLAFVAGAFPKTGEMRQHTLVRGSKTAFKRVLAALNGIEK
ncbi:hypothetical protein EH31_02150 [Erythrobacter longus]|uniref:Uncharacterized protein n=1 Tax=Erythrobacter longus TaxID=1044 RepID=A0A074M9J8_ERYLO|nr:hypothetical protein EH31_02150 [Erythrobacter longus]